MSSPPLPFGPPGSWAKAAAATGYGKSDGSDGCGKGTSPYGGKGGGKGASNPWQTTAIGIAWSKGFDEGFDKGMMKGKGKGKEEEQRRQEQIDDLVQELDAERFWAKQLEKALGI